MVMAGHHLLAMEQKLQAIVDRYKSGKSTLVGVLQDVPQEFGYLPEEIASAS